MEFRAQPDQALYDYAGQLMRRGLSNKRVQVRLQARGLTAQQAAVLTHQMRSQFREGYPPPNRLLALWQQFHRSPRLNKAKPALLCYCATVGRKQEAVAVPLPPRQAG